MSASRTVKILILIVIGVFAIVAYKFLSIYTKAYASNVKIEEGKTAEFFIYSHYTYDSVYAGLKESGLLSNPKNFDWTARKKNLPNHIYAGRYLIKKGMSNNELVNKFRSGSQDPVHLTFNNIRNLKELAQRVSEQLEPSANAFYSKLSDQALQKEYGFNSFTMASMFIPNTYEFYWNTSPEKFIKRMNDEYNRFWTNRRKADAEKLGLTQTEVITLASIVEEETLKEDERPKIAGVYLNRLDIGMRLQADPTVIFAAGDFEIRRVLNKHKIIDSPYNTYKYGGLPPGPICMPEISSIDAVLNFKKHKYLYFCAKADFSGYHSFAKTLNEHMKNARAYQKELNKRRIYN